MNGVDAMAGIPAGGLADAVERRTADALRSGDLEPIQTRGEVLCDGRIGFVVRIATSVRRKEREGAAGARGTPFLPPEPPLTVGAVGERHIAVLNKFHVIPGHLLLVTRTFEDQTRLLDEADFAALLRCLSEWPALAFYNGGAEAGASQSHKHLQMVPMPLSEDPGGAPVAPLMSSLAGRGRPARSPHLPFRHAACVLDGDLVAGRDAARSASCYRRLLATCGVTALAGNRQSRPYNLLMTSAWMLVVPRSREHFGRISINGLGFAGSLFVRDDESLDVLRRAGPLAALSAVGLPEPGAPRGGDGGNVPDGRDDWQGDGE